MFFKLTIERRRRNSTGNNSIQHKTKDAKQFNAAQCFAARKKTNDSDLDHSIYRHSSEQVRRYDLIESFGRGDCLKRGV